MWQGNTAAFSVENDSNETDDVVFALLLSVHYRMPMGMLFQPISDDSVDEAINYFKKV